MAARPQGPAGRGRQGQGPAARGRRAGPRPARRGSAVAVARRPRCPAADPAPDRGPGTSGGDRGCAMTQLTVREWHELRQLETVVHATGLCLARRLTDYDLSMMDVTAQRVELWAQAHTGPDVLAPLD